MYKVIRFFTDMKDFNHPYKVGDTYPREGMAVSEERLSELSGNLNRLKTPLIELVIEESAETNSGVETPEVSEVVKYTKTEINRMNKEMLVLVATSAGIEDAAEKSGTILKSLLIEKFNL